MNVIDFLSPGLVENLVVGILSAVGGAVVTIANSIKRSKGSARRGVCHECGRRHNDSEPPPTWPHNEVPTKKRQKIVGGRRDG